MRILLNPHAAPSAALPAGAGSPAPAVAPSAPASDDAPISEAELDRSVAESLTLLAEPPAATPATPPATESPAATGLPPAPPAVPDPAPGQAAPAAAPSGHPDDDPLPPEVEASLGDPGRRAIQTERERRKAATAKVAELQAENDRLKAQLAPAPNTPTPPLPAVPGAPGAPAVPAATPASSAAAWPSELARCETFEQVAHAERQASALGSVAMRLNTTLATRGLEAAVEVLRGQGLATFQGVPLEQLTAEGLADRLQQAWDTAEAVRLEAPGRAAFLRGERASFGQAVTVLPGLKDTQSAHAKQFNAIVAANPHVKQLGPEWPMLVTRQILGMEAEAKLRHGATPPIPAITPVTAAPVPPPPAAPRHAAVVPPLGSNSELETLRQKIDAGKATEEEMDRFASLELQAQR